MKFGIFYEHQLPRPWKEDSEYRLFQQSLDQIELADRLGYDYAWEVEHHFLEEYSHSSAPEVFLAAASQQRSRSASATASFSSPRTIRRASRSASARWTCLAAGVSRWVSVKAPVSQSSTPSTAASATSETPGRTPSAA